MSANGNASGDAILAPNPTCMESVNRITRLPVIDSTIKTATSFYEKVKDYNGLTHWTLSTAEITLCKAVDLGKPLATPVVKNFEGPIKKVDNVLCGGLDYIETKVPSVKLPPAEVYKNTKEYVNNTVTPAVGTAMSYAEPALKTARNIVEPAYERARAAVEPAVERARTIVEPYIQPALDKAHSIKDEVMHKVEEYIHLPHQEGETVECYECQQIKRRMEEENQSNQQNDHDQPQSEQHQ